jgi:hypothetical protein
VHYRPHGTDQMQSLAIRTLRSGSTTRVAELCKELGISRHTLFRHFSPDGESRANGRGPARKKDPQAALWIQRPSITWRRTGGFTGGPCRQSGQSPGHHLPRQHHGTAIGAPVGTALGSLLGWRASFLFLAGFGPFLTGLAVWLLPQVRRVPDAVRPSMRKAVAQPA